MSEKPQWIEQVEIKSPNNENINNAIKFAENNDTILSPENPNFESDKDFLDKMSDANWTLAAKNRTENTSLLYKVKEWFNWFIDAAKYVYNDIFPDIEKMSIEKIKSEILLTKEDLNQSQELTDRYNKYSQYLKNLKKELDKKEQK